MRFLSPAALGLAVFAFPLCASTPEVEFNRDVRPILSDKCYNCHGPDAAAKHIPMRLDSEAAARPVLTNGEFLRRVTSEDKARRMPPVYSKMTLNEREIDTLRRWVEQGAKWEKHWAFIPPKRPPVPQVKNSAWVRNPIDAFILARLEKEGLTPSAEASRETLLRRVSFDLTGLPPTPANTASKESYEQAVDHLLASPRYGERMAARWLDFARYADSNGYQYDGERVMWRWRDWVIDAFNKNQPFDQFTLEQIAGDMLPNARRDQIIATGFNRNHRANTEDGIIPEEYAVEYVVDRVETTSAVFLGLTMGCARCHNHKYDPIMQKEFYQTFAYFNNIPELGRAMKYGNSPPLIPAPTVEQDKRHENLMRQISAAHGELNARERAVAQQRAAWEKQFVSAAPIHWAPSRGLQELPDKSNEWELDGKNFIDLGKTAGSFDIEDRFTLAAWIYSDDAPDGSILTRMMDSPKGRGYGMHADHGKIHINLTTAYADDAIRLETEETLTPKQWHHVMMTYSGSRMAEGIHVYVDGHEAKVKVLLDTLYRPFNNAGKAFGEPLRAGGGWGATRRFHGRIREVRVYGRVLSADEASALGATETINEIAAKPVAERTATEKERLRWYYLDNAAPQDVRALWHRLQSFEQDRESLERSFPTVMVMQERPQRKDTFLLIRGAYDKPGDKVEPGIPAVLGKLPPGAPNNRLGFARWLISKENPLLARVTVNRMWQQYFGTGLVKTVEDFGAQGEWPSHPELLDWLATEFMRTGWDVKAMQKLIVTSATYRQSSRLTPELLSRDPENRLLARGPRVRLSAEMIRDQALFDAGLLSGKVGGPSVKPYQPDGLWKELSMQNMDYVQSHGADLYRRSLYTYWKRTIAPPEMINFDAANRETCVVRETRTNTPLQALNLMNDVTFLEASRLIGQRMLKEGGSTDADRLAYGYRLVLNRAPRPVEQQVLLDNLRYHRDYFSDAEKAKAFLTQGEAKPDATLAPRDLASYGAVASLILNLDEAITKE